MIRRESRRFSMFLPHQFPLVRGTVGTRMAEEIEGFQQIGFPLAIVAQKEVFSRRKNNIRFPVITEIHQMKRLNAHEVRTRLTRLFNLNRHYQTEIAVFLPRFKQRGR